MPHWFTVVIPARDSAQWIAPLLAHYAMRDIRPILLLDARTRDNTRQIAESRGARVVDITSFRFAEGLASLTRQLVQTPWVLFINDDEAPSLSLLDRLAGPPPPAQAQSVAIPRRWAWHVPGQPLQYGTSRHWQDRAHQPGADHHWSLFQPARVEFISQMHSDGFLIDIWSRLPPQDYLIHFEWVLRTRAQRAAKLRRYDRMRPGYGTFFANMYLPEDQPPGRIAYHPFGTTAYDELAEAYYAARPSMRASLRQRAAELASNLRRPLAIPQQARIGLEPDLRREIPYQ